MNESGTLTPRAAALLLGVRLDSIYALIWAGKLEAAKRDGRWEISRAAVDMRASSRHFERAGSTPDEKIKFGTR